MQSLLWEPIKKQTLNYVFAEINIIKYSIGASFFWSEFFINFIFDNFCPRVNSRTFLVQMKTNWKLLREHKQITVFDSTSQSRNSGSRRNGANTFLVMRRPDHSGDCGLCAPPKPGVPRGPVLALVQTCRKTYLDSNQTFSVSWGSVTGRSVC